MKYALHLLFALVMASTLTAQKSGSVDYPALGLSFTIPSGWVGQETEGGFAIGHNSIPGIILMLPHETRTVEQLSQEAQQGIQDANGTALTLQGSIQNLGANTIKGHYTGTLEWQPVKALGIGMVNPNGTGVTILALSTPDKYGNDLEKAASQLHTSVVFKKVDHGPILKQWEQQLANTRLTYMDSYNSPSYTDGGISGGYSSKTKIELCAAGYFNFNSRSNMSLGGDGVSGYSHGKDQGNGTWRIDTRSGQPHLILEFYNGDVSEYSLAYDDDKLMLNGRRFFRTTAGEYAPDCQ
jgi:hypothetical protein